MRYAYNEQQLVNVSKLVKKLIHAVFLNTNQVTLSRIKDEISLILGYRNSNEIKFIRSSKKDEISNAVIDKISGNLYLSDFCKIFGPSTLVRFLNGNLSKNKISFSHHVVIEDTLTHVLMDYAMPEITDQIVRFINSVDFDTYYFGENNDKTIEIRHWIEPLDGILFCKLIKEGNEFSIHISIKLRKCVLSGLPCEIEETAQVKINNFVDSPWKKIFLICAPPGRGKSYFIENNMMPLLQKKGRKIVRVTDKNNPILPIIA